MTDNDIYKYRKRVSELVEISVGQDRLSRFYDIFYTFLIFLNLTVCIAATFDNLDDKFGALFDTIENITVFFFIVDYILRIFSAPYKYKKLSTGKAVLSYVLSFMGIIDLISFLPNLLPGFFPSGAVAFRLFRMVRIFRIFRINAYYDSLNVIADVILSKWQQLISSFFIIAVMMIFSSMCMYSIEHDAQPDVFVNAFSGIWWSVSTLLTVGYGDIYPITPLGKFFSILITFLGVGMIAIPTGIISAGFVDQYSRIKKMSDYGREETINFIRVPVEEEDKYVGKRVSQLGLPKNLIVVAINRDGHTIVPRGDVVIRDDDVLVLGADSIDDDTLIDLKEVTIGENNPWAGEMIKELDISRKTLIVMIHRGNKNIVPTGSTKIEKGDELLLFTQSHFPGTSAIDI